MCLQLPLDNYNLHFMFLPSEILMKEEKIGYNNVGDYSLCVKSLNNASEIH